MLRLNTGLVTEDDFVNWVRSQNGVLHTRKVSNISTTNLSECPPNTIVCLTGYSQIVDIIDYNRIDCQVLYEIVDLMKKTYL